MSLSGLVCFFLKRQRCCRTSKFLGFTFMVFFVAYLGKICMIFSVERNEIQVTNEIFEQDDGSNFALRKVQLFRVEEQTMLIPQHCNQSDEKMMWEDEKDFSAITSLASSALEKIQTCNVFASIVRNSPDLTVSSSIMISRMMHSRCERLLRKCGEGEDSKKIYTFFQSMQFE